MEKVNSLIYVLYYLLIWVVLPSTGLEERVYGSEFGDRASYSIANDDTNFTDFQFTVNPDWNKLNSQESQKNWVFGTGHWPLLFSSVSTQLGWINDSFFNPAFSTIPILGSLTNSKIIFPFHYFW